MQCRLLVGVLVVDMRRVGSVCSNNFNDATSDADRSIGAGNVETGLSLEGETFPEIFVVVFSQCIQNLDIVGICRPVEGRVSFLVATSHHVGVVQTDRFDSGDVSTLSSVDDVDVRGCVVVFLHDCVLSRL